MWRFMPAWFKGGGGEFSFRVLRGSTYLHSAGIIDGNYVEVHACIVLHENNTKQVLHGGTFLRSARINLLRLCRGFACITLGKEELWAGPECGGTCPHLPATYTGSIYMS